MPDDDSHRLLRETFRTSRLSEFTTVNGLTIAIGHPPARWPQVIVKESADNSIDGCEEHGIAPCLNIAVSTERGEIVVADNGPGIPAKTVKSIIDYTVRTGSRAAYTAPTRGQMGNALQCAIAAPAALGLVGETAVIEAHGIANRISVRVDPVSQEPRVSLVSEQSSVKNGTRVTIRWPTEGIRWSRRISA